MRRCVLAVALLGAGAALRPALAAPIDDYLAEGYAIVRSTTVAGIFSGCTKNRSVRFSDGTIFSCTRSTPRRHLENGRVYILRKSDIPEVVVLIAGEPFDGTLLSWGGRTEKLEASIDPPQSPQTAINPATTGEIAPIQPSESISQLQDDRTTRLNDAQIQPVRPPPLPVEGPNSAENGAAQEDSGAGGH